MSVPYRSRAALLLVAAALLPGCAAEARPGDAAASGTPAAAAAAAPTPASATPSAAVADAGAATTAVAPAGTPEITVYKSPTCGCCSAWVDHLRENGFAVVERDTSDMDAIKRRHGVQPQHESCHTGLVNGYVVEGHVPADLVARLLTERPDAVGLAVPGMPLGSPGMEVGGRKEAYDVLLVGRDGRTTVFARR